MKILTLLTLLAALTSNTVSADNTAAPLPKLYGFCAQEGDAQKRSLPEEARLLRELGYDGGGYPLWFGEALAANLKRQLGDAAAKNGLRVSIYRHTGDYLTAALPFTVAVARQTAHPNVGFNFNLCHWLMANGTEDYRPLLRAHAEKLFVVTLNGATVGSTTWTNGLIRPLDEGDFDNRQLLATLRDIGYTGPVGLMCYGIPGDARDHLSRSMTAWRKLNAQPPREKQP